MHDTSSMSRVRHYSNRECGMHWRYGPTDVDKERTVGQAMTADASTRDREQESGKMKSLPSTISPIAAMRAIVCHAEPGRTYQA
jgi:hypothetical protein